MTRLLTVLLVGLMLLGGIGPDAALAAKRGSNGKAHAKPVTPADLVLPVAKASLGSTEGWYVVQTKPAAGDAGKVAQQLAKTYGLTVKNVYRKAITGFAAKVPDAQLAALKADPAVQSVEQDAVVTLVDPLPNADMQKKIKIGPSQTGSGSGPQVTPWGVARTEAPDNPLWQDAAANPIDAGIAVVDTGIDKTHPDLNVAGGVDCTSNDTTDYQDRIGHGTHVSGTAAAKDNGFGVVGVAPGARLYGVKVLGDGGTGTTSTLICGLEWVLANQSASGIDVANFSLGGKGKPTLEKGCANAAADSEEKAFCNLVDAGVTVVVAAGNSCKNAASFDPAMFDVVITVGAIADDDGKPGGLGGPTQVATGCGKGAPYVHVPDDTMAPFSNYGPDVDIWAPGVGILSTVPTSDAEYAQPSGYDGVGWSGTSMASPHVTGSAALWIATYRADHGGDSPTVAQVRTGLLTAGSSGTPGAESLLLQNTRFKKAGNKKMPKQVDALVVNDSPNGPWATTELTTAKAKNGKGKHAGKSGKAKTLATSDATPTPDATGDATSSAAATKTAKAGKQAKAHKAKHQKHGK